MLASLVDIVGWRWSYWFPRSPATLRIPGTPSNASDAGMGSESSLLRPVGLTLGTAVGMLCSIVVYGVKTML